MSTKYLLLLFYTIKQVIRTKELEMRKLMFYLFFFFFNWTGSSTAVAKLEIYLHYIISTYLCMNICLTWLSPISQDCETKGICGMWLKTKKKTKNKKTDIEREICSYFYNSHGHYYYYIANISCDKCLNIIYAPQKIIIISNRREKYKIRRKKNNNKRGKMS